MLDAALRHVSRERLAERLRQIVDIPSPTGEELALARHLAEELAAAGLAPEVQHIDDSQGNALGRYGGDRGAELLLYAPTDTAFSGNPDEDRPWLGDRPGSDLRLPAVVEAGKVIGLGAENPKSFVAVILEAVTALAATRADVPGRVTAGFGAGGMPNSGRPGLARRDIGHGAGCRHLVEKAGRPDFAIIVKPGYAVSWEEVGLSWHTVRVRGLRNYTGIRHKVPWRNPIVDAARVIGRLEAWFPEYSARHTSGLVSPQGSVNAVRAGSGDLSAFVPELCELFLDIRVSPRSSPEQVAAELKSVLDGLCAEDPGLDLSAEMTVGIPGTHTPPESWIVGSLIRAWETAEGRRHQPPSGTSGATDAAILRGLGIPTARIGPPAPRTPNPPTGFSMGVADVESLERLTRLLLRAIVDTVTRSRDALGLAPRP